jgi:PAS domain S-box-containing protein
MPSFSQTAAHLIRRCVTPPLFPNDDNKTLIARALHFVTLCASVTLLMIAVNALLFAREKAYSMVFISVGLAVTLATNWQNRLGHVRRASFMMVTFGWAVVTLFVFLSGGLDTISSSLYVTVIIMAALFLGWRAGAFVMILTLALMLGIAAVDEQLVDIPRLFPLEGSTNWLVLAYSLLLVLIMVISIESGLRESQARFRLISSATSDYTFSSGFDAQGQLEYILLTGAFESITGYTPDEFRQAGGWRAILHPDDLQQDDRDMAALRRNQPVVSEIRIIRKDGAVRWVRVFAKPVWDAQRNRLAAINGAGQDITEQKAAQEALRESEERFRLISSVTSDYTFSTAINEHGEAQPRLLTGAFEAITGYTPDEYMQAGGWRAMLHPDDLEQDRRDLAAVMSSRQVISEIRIIRKDGAVRWVRVYAHPVCEAGRVTGINGAVKDITEQKVAEEALRESEERFRLISSVTSDYTFSSRVRDDGSLEHTLLTGAFQAISGYSPDEFRARGGWRSTVHPDDLQQDDRDMAALRRNQPIVTEIRIIRKDGAVRWVRVYAHPVWDAEHNRLAAINGAVQDITEQKTAQEALRQSEKLLRALQDATTDIAFLMALDGTFLTVNKQFADLVGTSIENMIGRNGFDMLTPELRAARRQRFDEVIRTKAPLRWEDVTPTAWWDNSLYPVLSPDGEVQAFAVYSRDITEQKRLEAEVAKYTEQLELMVEERTVQLRQAKEQIELILNHSTDAVALAQPDGDIQMANPAYYEMFGVQASQAVERILSLVAKDEFALAISQSILQVIQQGEGKRLEVQIVAPDGAARDIDLVLIPVRLRHDDPRCGILISAHDITTLKDMERFKARFVGNAVHDLGNPITGLLMRLHFLKNTPDRLDEHVSALQNQIEHFRDIIEDLRTLSHLDQNQLTLRLAASSINDMARRVFDTYEPMAMSKQQAFIFNPQADLPPAWVDIRQLERVMVNLVTNAINYTPEGKQIEIATALDGDDIIITVKDQGIGIDSHDTSRVFDRFYRASTARKANANGTGLGLAIVKEIVELHGGSVSLASQPGHGSTFTVRIPARQ